MANSVFDTRERFVEAARQIGVDEDPNALDRAFRKVVPPKSGS